MSRRACTEVGASSGVQKGLLLFRPVRGAYGDDDDDDCDDDDASLAFRLGKLGSFKDQRSALHDVHKQSRNEQSAARQALDVLKNKRMANAANATREA